jgi:uncharacterized protein (TIGR03086 family)
MDNIMKSAVTEAPDRLERTLDLATGLVSAIKPEQWHNSTLCEEWDLRVLVNHIIGENLWISAILGGRTMAQVGNEFDGDLTGDDPIMAYVNSVALAKAVLTPAALAADYKLSFGRATGLDYVTQIFMDELVHSWDVMKGSGQSVAFDDELVTAGISIAQEVVAVVGQGSVFGYSQEIVPDESQLDLLLGVVGRKGTWTPPAGGIAR